ncbi:cytochrome c oxidase assembly factor Coa1 family protein [Planctomycetes bacterium K23_9]|uniref:Cytochrome oxidase complex assembly protein 1 n=1 Tax=Stieleria marina TaxID=1930275 RepID=A0A517P0R3_9BACT|nr:Cytochrome oxidase complex assembly protein 1 [Planctomycetes bacterium K23_9]
MSDEINPFSRQGHSPNQPVQQGGPGERPSPPAKKKGLGFVVALVLGLFAAGLVCCGGLAFFGFKAGAGMLNAPIDAAIAYVSSDEELANQLGTPIESTSTVGVQNYQNNNGNGHATVGFNAKGSNGTARVDGKLLLTAGTWTVEKLTVKLSDGQTVTLPRGDAVEVNAGQGDADPTEADPNALPQ